MKTFSAFCVSFMGLNMLWASTAQALCPVCAIALGAGVGFSRWLGVDDAITGLWAGALVVAITMWTNEWLERRAVRFTGRDILVAAGYYALTLIPLYYAHFFAHPVSSLGITVDKLMLGIIVGSFAFWCTALWYLWMKARHGGHAYFPFQKVVMPLALLVVLSGVFYLLTA